MARMAQIAGLMVLMLAPVALLDCSLKRSATPTVSSTAEAPVRGREVLW